MRELKFRAWQFDIKKMFIPFAVGIGGRTPNHLYHIMQYTGLHDKTGKEIYEGDILKYVGTTCCHCGLNHKYEGHDYYVISWNQKQASCECLETERDSEGFQNWMDPIVWNDCLVVVGNVHENPELLNE